MPHQPQASRHVTVDNIYIGRSTVLMANVNDEFFIGFILTFVILLCPQQRPFSAFSSAWSYLTILLLVITFAFLYSLVKILLSLGYSFLYNDVLKQ